MTTHEIVTKLWNLCNVLRDDGITYHQYVTELTYILFLKMAKETQREAALPFDFMIAADTHVKQQTGDYFKLPEGVHAEWPRPFAGSC